MTLLDDRPTTTNATSMPAASRSPFASWRLAARLARREVRRRPGRTALAALLIAVPVAAMTAGSTIARTNADDWSADFQRDYGDADLVLGLPWLGDAVGATLDVPAEGRVIGSFVQTSTMFTPVDADPGELHWGTLTDRDFTNPVEAAAVEVTDGRPPREGEVLLDPDLARRLGVEVGERLVLDRPSGSWLVAGLGRLRGDYWTDLVAIPGFDLDRIVPEQRNETVLVALPATTTPAEIVRIASEHGALTRYASPWAEDQSSLRTGMRWGYVAGLLALVAVGIIVAAAFATSARRQLVTIGQLSSNGASERVVRRTLFLQGSWTGAIGTIIGVVGGFAVLPIAIPLVEQHIVQHEIRALRLSLGDLVVIVVTAVVAATVAAAVPARSASRVPVMAALAGRRPTPVPPAWLVPTGVALFLGGLGLVAVAALGARGSDGGNDTWAGLTVLGATGMVFGVCCASPLVVERVGRSGRSAPLAWRIALRSLARSRTRSAAVVAAVAVAVGGAVAAAAVAEASVRARFECCPGGIPADTVLIRGYPAQALLPEEPAAGQLVDLGPLAPFDPPAAVVEFLADVDAEVSPLLAATFDPEPFDPQMDGIDPLGPMIATPALLELMGLSDADLAVLAEEGALNPYFDRYGSSATGPYVAAVVQPTWDFRAESGTITVPARNASEPVAYSVNGMTVMTEAAARDAGFDVVQHGVIIGFDGPLTSEQIRQVRILQDDLWQPWADAFVEPGDDVVDRSEAAPTTSVEYDDPTWRNGYNGDLWTTRVVIVAAALLLSLLVVSIGMALAAAEGRDERETFAIVGARPSSMRRLAAANAAVVPLCGIVLGVPLGYLPVRVVDHITRDPYDQYRVPVRFPLLVVITLLVVIPLVAAAGAWATTALGQRFRPPKPTRRD